MTKRRRMSMIRMRISTTRKSRRRISMTCTRRTFMIRSRMLMTCEKDPNDKEKDI